MNTDRRLSEAMQGDSEGRQGKALKTTDWSQRPQVMGTRVMLMDHLNVSPCALRAFSMD